MLIDPEALLDNDSNMPVALKLSALPDEDKDCWLLFNVNGAAIVIVVFLVASFFLFWDWAHFSMSFVHAHQCLLFMAKFIII